MKGNPEKRRNLGVIQRICVDISVKIQSIFGFMKRGSGGWPGSRPLDSTESHDVGLAVAISSGLATDARATAELVNPSCNCLGGFQVSNFSSAGCLVRTHCCVSAGRAALPTSALSAAMAICSCSNSASLRARKRRVKLNFSPKPAGVSR